MILRGRVFWKFVLGHVALAVAGLSVGLYLLVGAVARIDAERRDREQVELTARIAALVRGRLNLTHAAELDRIARSLGSEVDHGTRVTILLPDGRVIADSEGDVARMDSHADRPEVVAALANEVGTSVRWSNTVARQLRYTARRIGQRDAPEGVVRVAIAVGAPLPVSDVTGDLAWKIGLVGSVFIAVIASWIAARWYQRISHVTHTVRRLSRGEPLAPLDLRGKDELALTARLLNRISRRFSRQLNAIEQQRRTLETILAHLGEGIIVAAPDGRIVLMNHTAREMLGIEESLVRALHAQDEPSLERLVPHHDLQRLLLETSTTGEPASESAVEVRLELPGVVEERTVLARVTPLERIDVPPSRRRGGLDDADVDADHPQAVGRLLVLTDVTELTRSVRMKTDFVANASHELRTPLSAIRGAVETLLQMNLATGDSAAPRFLEMVARHARRLEALAADLLALSRIEGGARSFKPAAINLTSFRTELYDRWRDAAGAGQLSWSVDVRADHPLISANPYLLNLILDNLIENAVKFTASGGRVDVRLTRTEEALVIDVGDNGCGIPEAERTRVFERFYQAPPVRGSIPARTSATRGTGLGLSIVRHAVAAMNGTVVLESEVGKGTTVTVRLPQPKPHRNDA